MKIKLTLLALMLAALALGPGRIGIYGNSLHFDRVGINLTPGLSLCSGNREKDGSFTEYLLADIFPSLVVDC